MNEENILALIAHLEGLTNPEAEPDLGFNMRSFCSQTSSTLARGDKSGHHCKTTACIAGHAFYMTEGFDKDKLDQTYATKIQRKAAAFLGLTKYQTGRLFCPDLMDDYGIPLNTITLNEAITTLKHFAETGFVNWGVALGDRYE